MKLKILCRCSFFLPGRAKDLSAPLYMYIYIYMFVTKGRALTQVPISWPLKTETRFRSPAGWCSICDRRRVSAQVLPPVRPFPPLQCRPSKARCVPTLYNLSSCQHCWTKRFRMYQWRSVFRFWHPVASAVCRQLGHSSETNSSCWIELRSLLLRRLNCAETVIDTARVLKYTYRGYGKLYGIINQSMY